MRSSSGSEDKSGKRSSRRRSSGQSLAETEPLMTEETGVEPKKATKTASTKKVTKVTQSASEMHECSCTRTAIRVKEIAAGKEPTADDLYTAAVENLLSDPFMGALLGAVRELDESKSRKKK